MNKKNKILIGTIVMVGVILVAGLFCGILFTQESTSVSRKLNENVSMESEKKQEQEQDQLEREESDEEKNDELREVFGKEVFDEKEYYVDDEAVAREIIRLQGEAFRAEVSEDSEVREIEKNIEENCEMEAVNLQDLDLEMAQYVELACEYMYNRYPCLKGFLTNISVQEDISNSTGVIALYDTGTFLFPPESDNVYPFTIKRQVLLNAEDFYRPKRIKNMITRCVREGHWRENTSVTSIFVHELTHCLIDRLVCEEYGLGTSICITEENGDAFGACATQDLADNQTMEKEICNTAYKNYLTEQGEECTYEEFCLQISGYAVGTQDDGGISYGETISEAMTDVYINGENCTLASRAIIDEVETRLIKLNLEVNEIQ